MIDEAYFEFNCRPLGYIINVPIKYVQRHVFYFDADGVLQAKPKETKIKSVIENAMVQYDAAYLINEDPNESKNLRVFRWAAARIKVGDTYDRFQELLKEGAEHYKEQARNQKEPEPLYTGSFVTSFERPIIQRLPENDQTNTFDFVKVRMNYRSIWPVDQREYILDNIKPLIDTAIEYLEKRREYTKFGVPVNCLMCTAINNMKSCTLEFVFELKIKENAQEK